MSDEHHHHCHPTKVCIKCGCERTKVEFAKRQWRRDQPSCLVCAPSEAEQRQTKSCDQCRKKCDEGQFPKKEWKRERPLCRLCFELTNISKEQTRKCRECKLVNPRNQYNVDQWGKGDKALCNGCRATYEQKIFASIGTTEAKELPDGALVCSTHSLELCDICMVDHSLTNRFARMKTSLGRDLTSDECEEVSKGYWEDSDIHINRKMCILDGQAMCPRSGRKLRCACNEATYCSKDCQLHHWTIHKMTCKVRLAKAKKKKDKADKKTQTALSAQPSHGLTEAQLNFIRIEAFLSENLPGGKHSIAECAWQLGEHPLIIGGGKLHMSANGQEFTKGDIHKIYMDAKGVAWDGSPRFGMRPYVQQKRPFDWIAKARQGKSQRMIDLERKMGVSHLN
eukprot:scaffold798_cov268-Chaetoceros_neogracile.AAC.5